MNFHVITLFPDAFSSYLGESILKRAIEDKKINVKFYNPRNFTRTKKEKKFQSIRIDKKPYGGGPGMVIQAEPVIRAVAKALGKYHPKNKFKIIFFNPGGKIFTTEYAHKISEKYTDVILICGRYEGIDARVKKVFTCEDISVGDYVLTGGELPAMIVVDCISRQIEGVLGDFNSREESRIASHDVYTRPEVFEYKKKKYKVPKILLSGNHKKIDEWRKEE